MFPILIISRASNCKYSILGGVRAVAQIISYEVTLGLILLGAIIRSGSLNLTSILENQHNFINLVFIFPLRAIWLVSRLAETNRTPYDFSEGESELVSGFNTEYGAVGFVLIFISEYSGILVISLFFRLIFIGGGSLNVFTVVFLNYVRFLFIWVRARLPRYRYDKLIDLAWLIFLPVCLVVLIILLGALSLLQ